MDISQSVRDHYSKLGKRSLQTMTVEQRKERARKAVVKKWENYKKAGVDKSENK